jgi:hypothetical protein
MKEIKLFKQLPAARNFSHSRKVGKGGMYKIQTLPFSFLPPFPFPPRGGPSVKK